MKKFDEELNIRVVIRRESETDVVVRWNYVDHTGLDCAVTGLVDEDPERIAEDNVIGVVSSVAYFDRNRLAWVLYSDVSNDGQVKSLITDLERIDSVFVSPSSKQTLGFAA